MIGGEFVARRAPYAPISALHEFFQRIRERGVPSRVDRKYLQKLSVATSNEWALLSALKFLGIVDEHGAPTHAYRLLQTTDRFEDTLRHLVETSYKDLLDIGGLEMSDEDLVNYFRVVSSASQAKNAARFFKAVCSLAGLEGVRRVPADVAESLEMAASKSADAPLMKALVEQKEAFEARLARALEDALFSMQTHTVTGSQVIYKNRTTSRFETPYVYSETRQRRIDDMMEKLIDKLPAMRPEWTRSDYEAVCNNFLTMVQALHGLLRDTQQVAPEESDTGAEA